MHQILLMLCLLLFTGGCQKQSENNAFMPHSFTYTYDFDSLVSKNYTGDFGYLEIEYFAKRIALPVIGSYCAEPVSSDSEIVCEKLQMELPYFDIKEFFVSLNENMFVMAPD